MAVWWRGLYGMLCFLGLFSLCVVQLAHADDAPLPIVPVPALPVSLPKPTPKPTVVDAPPLAMPSPFESSGMANGVGVSQPLQPVLPLEHFTESPQLTMIPEAASPLPHSWLHAEYLLWWPKTHDLPPLLISSRSGTEPRLGGPNTITLLGELNAESQSSNGGRFTYGFQLSDQGCRAVSVTYLFLNGLNRQQFVSGDTAADRRLARPVLNPSTGFEDSIPVATPGDFRGTFRAATSTRITGWEVTGLANLVSGPQAQIHGLLGYRYLQLHEGLQLEQFAEIGGSGSAPPLRSLTADLINTQNSFHGGQIGLMADVVHGSLFLEVTGKFAIGQAQGTSQISGQQILTQGSAVRANQVGILAQPTNATRIVNSAFAVLPEGLVKVGYRFRGDSRIYLGYNFMYLSEVLRPGDQIDRSVDPRSVSLFGASQGANDERPAVLLNRSDFWVQGLILGFELRF